ncbi:MAG: LysR family transcriptional regulator [Rhodobacteraceae bacterium]|nr:LysR family transcriptional regulator [Paracoccaceae bacterium]
MDWTNLPSLNALKAFAALAETRSFSAAGEALNVTHAAVSQQVRALEAHLGASLAVRDGRGIRLTPDGARLAAELEAGFARIGGAIAMFRQEEERRPVQVTMSPAFAVNWLLPRLPEFQRQNPGITLLLNPTAKVIEFADGGLDVAMRYREKTGPQPPVDVLMDLDILVVGAASLVGGREVGDPADLIGFAWLQELGTNEVARWFARRGVAINRPLMISHMPGNLIMEAVRRGDGITYTPRPLVQDDIDRGRLVEIYCEPGYGTIYLETRPGTLRKPVRKFVTWLRGEAEKDRQAGVVQGA